VLHVHVKAPGVFVQVALASQLAVFFAHSSMSVQIFPLPVNPTLQAHFAPVGVSVQVAWGSHIAAPLAHRTTLLPPEPLEDADEDALELEDADSDVSAGGSLPQATTPTTAAHDANDRTDAIFVTLAAKRYWTIVGDNHSDRNLSTLHEAGAPAWGA
jgi:hypothetical protein